MDRAGKWGGGRGWGDSRTGMLRLLADQFLLRVLIRVGRLVRPVRVALVDQLLDRGVNFALVVQRLFREPLIVVDPEDVEVLLLARDHKQLGQLLNDLCWHVPWKLAFGE